MTNERDRQHCCDRMAAHLKQQDVPVTYSPRFREYGLNISDGGSAKQLIQFCPWCGTRLPGSLRDAWFERIEALQIDPEDASLPEDMKSDAWWRTAQNLTNYA